MRAVISAAVLACSTLAAAAADYVVVPIGPVRPTVYAQVYDAVPTCDDPGVLGRIGSRFAAPHAGYWGTGFSIAAIGKIRETRLGSVHASLIARRNCVAEAVISNGHVSPIYYLIESDGGFAGLGHRVSFCLPAYDPWRVRDGNCRTLR